MQLPKFITESSGRLEMRAWPESYHRSCFYGSVENFRLFTPQFTDCETPCVWCWFVCLWASCGLPESPPAACKNRNHTKLMDGINLSGTTRLNFRTHYCLIYSLMTCFILLKNAASIIMPMTIQCLIRHRPCKLSCQIYSLTAELLLNGLVLMEWKRILINSNWWFYRQTRPMTLNWSWMKIPHSDLKNQSRLWESSQTTV